MTSIIEDTRQKENKHAAKHKYWNEAHVDVIRSALKFGDYIKVPKVAVDTKENIQEIGGNMCGNAKEKKRFAEECKRSRDFGCKLIFLIEDSRYKEITDLYETEIYLHNGMVIPGEQLATAMFTMQERYGCRFMFCDPKDAGRIIVELLETEESG